MRAPRSTPPKIARPSRKTPPGSRARPSSLPEGGQVPSSRKAARGPQAQEMPLRPPPGGGGGGEGPTKGKPNPLSTKRRGLGAPFPEPRPTAAPALGRSRLRGGRRGPGALEGNLGEQGRVKVLGTSDTSADPGPGRIHTHDPQKPPARGSPRAPAPPAPASGNT